MPKFAILKDQVNEALLKVIENRVEEYLEQYFDKDEVIRHEHVFSFRFGTVDVFIQVRPWHFDDALVHVYSYLAEDVGLNISLAEELLRLNSTVPLGNFGVTFDNTVVYSYSLPGKHLDDEEFLAAVQTVASVADQYDEKIKGFTQQPDGSLLLEKA
jgi:hypothetical protein